MPNPIKIQAEVLSNTRVAIGVYSLVLLPSKRRFSFHPGQFLHLAIDQYDPSGGFWPDSRVFSIASSPEAETIEIVYSVKGVFTRRMVDEIKTGDAVWLKFPYGNFIISTYIHSAIEKIVVIAGGTGISPFLSFFRSGAAIQGVPDLHIYWGVKTPEVFGIFPDMKRYMNGNSTIYLYCEEPGITTLQNITPGMLPIKDILRDQGNCIQNLYFLSGPPRMIDTFKNVLLENNVPAQNIIIDDWE